MKFSSIVVYSFAAGRAEGVAPDQMMRETDATRVAAVPAGSAKKQLDQRVSKDAAAAHITQNADNVIELEEGSVSIDDARRRLAAEDSLGVWALLEQLAGGTGARTMTGKELVVRDGVGISERQLQILLTERNMVRRMNVQDLGVLLLLATIYIITLCFGWSVVYRMSGNQSSVTYFADPRHHPLVSDANTVDGLLEDFDIPPAKVYLHVVGWEKTPAAHGVLWRHPRWRVQFQFGLDLSSFVEKAEEISDEDRLKIQEYLLGGNDLENLVIEKDTIWPGVIEQLGVNIKQKLKGSAAHQNTIIDIQIKGADELLLFKNRTWANFLHNRTTKTLFVLSVVGAMWYFPYMAMRQTTMRVKSMWRINNSIANFWELVDAKLNPADAESFLNDPLRRHRNRGDPNPDALTVPELADSLPDDSLGISRSSHSVASA